MSVKPFSKSEINGFITNLCNGSKSIRGKQLEFLREAVRINLNERRSFCYADFPQMSSGNFRQYISKLRPFIATVCKSNPCFYKIIGTPDRMAIPSITDNPTGEKMLMMLRNAREQPASIHDIRIYVNSENFHDILKDNGKIANKNNSGILLPTFHYDVNTRAKVHVYPRSISIDIACTNRPLVYDVSGVSQLLIILGKLSHELDIISRFQAKFPPVLEWIVKTYHFGRDATQSFSGESFEMVLNEVTFGSFRYYNKLDTEGNRKLRIEYLAHPDIPLMQEIDKMISQEEKFQECYLEKRSQKP